MLLYYIRHGEPLGVPDYSLTPLGREQAKALAKRLCLFGIDRVFASPTLRTMQTAQPICDLLGKEITPCDWADEGIVWNEFTVPHPKYEHTWVFFDPHYLEIFSSPEVRALGEKWYEHPELKKYNFKKEVTYYVKSKKSFINCSFSCCNYCGSGGGSQRPVGK